MSFPKSAPLPPPGLRAPEGAVSPADGGWGGPARRRASVQTQIGYMRARGMSDTGIRRALGLSEREAVAAGIIPRRLIAAHGSEASAPDTSAAATDGNDGRIARANEARGPLMADVLAAVARAGNVSREDILGAGQKRHLTPLRQLTMCLLRELCAGASLPAIGHFLGRDHTTVHYGCRKASMRLRSEPGFRHLYEAVRSRLAQPAAPADG